METKVAISEFKTHCLEILKDLGKDNSSIIITKRDRPIAKVSPLPSDQKSIFGLLASKAEISDDIIAPINDMWGADE